MKYDIKSKRPLLWAAAACAVVLAATTANATEFSGSLAFGSSSVTTDNTDLQLATEFNITGAFTTAETGIYSTLGVTDFHPVSFHGFSFNPAVTSVTPLWAFALGTTDFSLNATSVSSHWLTTVGGGEWVISGMGMASITGFTDTPGTWTVNFSTSGNLSLGFDSTADLAPPRSVPDTAGTGSLLGGALLGLGILRRKLNC